MSKFNIVVKTCIIKITVEFRFYFYTRYVNMDNSDFIQNTRAIYYLKKMV